MNYVERVFRLIYWTWIVFCLVAIANWLIRIRQANLRRQAMNDIPDDIMEAARIRTT